MPNPKRKHTRSRRDSRRAQNWRMEMPGLSPCSNPACGKPRPPHAVCPHCGFYGGKLVVAPKAPKKKGGEENPEEGQG